MRVPETAILSTLRNGGVIKSFYRRSARNPRPTGVAFADGYVLASPNEQGEVMLSHADFLSVKSTLVEAESWEQVVGNTRFGGSSWVLRHTSDE